MQKNILLQNDKLKCMLSYKKKSYNDKEIWFLLKNVVFKMTWIYVKNIFSKKLKYFEGMVGYF